MERNIDVIKDADGNSILMINDIRFKGKHSVNWDDVKMYFRNCVGTDMIHDSHFPFMMMTEK